MIAEFAKRISTQRILLLRRQKVGILGKSRPACLTSHALVMNKIFIVLAALLVSASTCVSQPGDAALRSVVEKDRSSRAADGRLMTLSAGEHLARGRVYFD